MWTHTHSRSVNSQQDAASISSAEWGMTTDLTIGRQHTGALLVTRVVFLEACRQLHFPWWEYAKLIKSCCIKGGRSFQISNDCFHFAHSLRDPRLVLKDRLWTGPMGPLTASGLQAEINAETSHYRCKIEIDRRTALKRVTVTVGRMWNKWRNEKCSSLQCTINTFWTPCISFNVLYWSWYTKVISTVFRLLLIIWSLQRVLDLNYVKCDYKCKTNKCIK